MHTIFLSLLNITNEDLRIVYQENNSLLKNMRKNSKERKVGWGCGVGGLQSTIPTKIKKKSVNVIQSYKFGPDA